MKKEKERKTRELLGDAGSGASKGICANMPPVLERMCSATRDLTNDLSELQSCGTPSCVLRGGIKAVRRAAW